MRKLLLYGALFAVALTGCSQFEEPIQVQESQSVATAPKTRAGTTPVFETMENPYTLARMRRLKGNPFLQPTHYYGRFLPENKEELDLLEDTYNLELFDFPLDVNIEDETVTFTQIKPLTNL